MPSFFTSSGRWIGVTDNRTPTFRLLLRSRPRPLPRTWPWALTFLQRIHHNFGRGPARHLMLSTCPASIPSQRPIRHSSAART